MARRLIEVTPREVYKATEPFVDDIPSGGTVSSRDVDAFDSAGVDKTATVISGVGGTGTDVTFTFSNGTDFEDYRVEAKVTLATGAVIERPIEFRVRSQPRT